MLACSRAPTLKFFSSLTTLTPGSMASITHRLRAPRSVICCPDVLPDFHIQLPTQHLNCISKTCISNITWLKWNSCYHSPYYHSPAWHLSFRLCAALTIESKACKALLGPLFSFIPVLLFFPLLQLLPPEGHSTTPVLSAPALFASSSALAWKALPLAW